MTVLEEIFKHPIAHRGLHNRKKGVIENSRTAFAQAIKHGYSIECDLQLTGDGVPVVFHDPVLNRLTRQTGAISKLSAGQLSRIRLTASKKSDTPQTFSQMLEQVNGAVPLIIELKNQTKGRNSSLAKAAVAIAKEYQGPLVFKSFYPDIITSVKSAGFTGPVGIIVTRIHAKDDDFATFSVIDRIIVNNLLHYPKTRFDFISSDHNTLDLPAVRLFRKYGFPVMTWTINSFEIEQGTRGHADQLVFENYMPYRASK